MQKKTNCCRLSSSSAVQIHLSPVSFTRKIFLPIESNFYLQKVLIFLCLLQRSTAGCSMFSGCSWVCACEVKVWWSRMSNLLENAFLVLLTRCLQITGLNFTKTSTLIHFGTNMNSAFWGQKVKGQGHSTIKGPAGGGIQSYRLCVEF